MEGKDRASYDLPALRRRIPEDRAEFFLGFVSWAEDADGWKRSVKEALPETEGRSVVRTVWDDPKDKANRVLIDAVECDSAQEAMEALIDRLAWNQIAGLPEGPEGLGYASFVHPAGAPPALFFARGNLCIGIASFGRRAVAVGPWAARLNRRLDERPTAARELISLRTEGGRIGAGQRAELEYSMPWRYGEGGYLKFVVHGASLARRAGRLVLVAGTAGRASVDAYILEPGREALSGRLTVAIE